MPDPRLTAIENLIQDYRAADKDMTEANVEAAFVARLFAVLGWATDDPTVWNRQVFVRGAGFADVGLQIQNKPVLFLEAKRFGKLKGPADAVQAALFGDDVVLSQADRQRAGIDRTPEEKQAMRYARAQEVHWAVLANFERLVLFDANEERIILAFDAPEEYVSRFDDLKMLAPQPTPQQFQSHLNWYKGLQKKADVDADFFDFLNRWRVRLAQDMFDQDVEREEPLFHPPTGERLERLMEAVQRVLDRLIILRYADDVGVLLQHDLLENLLAYHHGRLAYVQEYDLQREVNRLFHDFYRAHNTTIFAPGHVCEQALIRNKCLVNLVREISSISFRKFSSDILGNTYESYLGQKLQLVDSQLVPKVRKDVRRGEGIYYTPGYIVGYIVDHTLGRWLYGTEDGRPPLPSPQPPPSPDHREREGVPPQAAAVGEGRKTLADLDGLRVLDPAMGSGSFLIYAFDVLADFYERENARIEAENNAAMQAWSERAMKEGMFGKEGELPPPQIQPTEPNYIEKILQEHLYGVDLDPEAVEIAGVNLIMAAFRRLTRNRQPHRKLPLILRQNLKCGNSLISGDQGEGISEEEYNEALERLVELRGELRELRDDAARAEKLAEIEAAAAPLNVALNEKLREYFGDEVAAKRPFNWAVEFPEAFDPRRPKEQRGFTVVVGNPPYVRSITLKAADPKGWTFYRRNYTAAKKGEFDVYLCFVERGHSLLAQTGHFGYILANKWFTTQVGTSLRRLLAERQAVEAIVDFGHFQVFPSVTTYTCLLFLAGGSCAKATIALLADAQDSNQPLPNRGGSWQTGIFPAAELSAEPWTFGMGAARRLLERLAELPRLEDIASIFQGIGTRADPVFVLQQRRDDLYSPALDETIDIEPNLLKPGLTGRDIDPYCFATDTRLLFPYRFIEGEAVLVTSEEIQHRYPKTSAYLNRCENRDKLEGRESGRFRNREDWYAYSYPRNITLLARPKLVLPDIAYRAEVAYDAEGRYIIDTAYGILVKDTCWSPLALTAVLNSSMLTFFLRETGTVLRGGYFRMKTAYLNPFPIPAVDFSNPTEKAQHDALVELAQRMHDLNQAKQEAERAFVGILRGYERETASLWRAYWDHTEYRPHLQRHPLLDANATGEVSAVSVDEEPSTQLLLIRAEVSGDWQDVARLTIPDEDLRLFLFFALRQFLHENRRKKVWARGRVLRGLLEVLNVPVLVPASAAANLARVAQLMADFRTQCLPEALHLSELERTLRETDAEIDHRVYDLYGLTEEERRVVEESVK